MTDLSRACRALWPLPAACAGTAWVFVGVLAVGGLMAGCHHVLPAWWALDAGVPSHSTVLPAPSQPRVSACQLPPPADARLRKMWDEECR
ncbi:MAG: hypothetical protein K2W33_15715 [Burkholderiales bacterium]|nr:hypothetical protein [Burkholderiales bacterium]